MTHMHKDAMMEPITMHGKLKHAKGKNNALSSCNKIKHNDDSHVAVAQRKWLIHVLVKCTIAQSL